MDKPSHQYDGSCGNKMLLWHGSRLTNWVGILSQGLRIAPPEAPCTGYSTLSWCAGLLEFAAPRF